MSYIRAGGKKLFSKSQNQGLYVFLSGTDEEQYIEDYGELKNPEDFCEVMFRILDQGGVEVTKEMVNKARDRLGLEPVDEVGGEHGKTEEFKEKVNSNE